MEKYHIVLEDTNKGKISFYEVEARDISEASEKVKKDYLPKLKLFTAPQSYLENFAKQNNMEIKKLK